MAPTNLSNLPGAGLTERHLSTAATDSPERTFWFGLLRLATALGLRQDAGSHACHSLTLKSVDQLAPEVTQAIGDSAHLVPAVEATVALTESRFADGVHFEVRILRTNGTPHWEAVRTATTSEEAEELMRGLRARHPEATYVLAEVITTTETTLIPPRKQR